ncbi:MAG: MBL fold metallo-hydrolase [Clostridia bacterium]|nr:MBL fold metallo-hydrolase [Clostridia bacterium]
MTEITKNLYQFSIYIPPIDFTIHQYLYASEPSILFAAGTVQQAKQILPEIKEILGDRELKYIFVSHMESDEAGGIPVFKKEYPGLTVICGDLAARELSGYGYEGNIIAECDGELIEDGELRLRLFDYPAEVHNQNGLLCLEENSGIFYSADLMLRYGNEVGNTIRSDWHDEVNSITAERIKDDKQRKELQCSLHQIDPRFVAVGHGYCIECECDTF